MRGKTGTIKFDSIPQRLNVALTVGLIVSCANSVQFMDIQNQGKVESHLLLLFVALWGLKIFIDDHHSFVPSKARPGLDVLFLIFSSSSLILAAAYGYKFKLMLVYLAMHFVFLTFWNFLACAIRKQWGFKHKLFNWMIVDFIFAAWAFVVIDNLNPTILTLFIVSLFILLVVDSLLSKTLDPDKLIGDEG